jgi:hypothetical protein
VVISHEYLGGNLDESEMFRDDIWWNVADEDAPVSQIRIQVQPGPALPQNPMVTKAEEIFRQALKK